MALWKSFVGIALAGVLALSPGVEARSSGGGHSFHTSVHFISHPYHGGGHHTGRHGGRYAGGMGSSHRGGHYINAKTGNHYGRHK